MFLFGLTWLFAILTFSVTGLRETFQILFVVFNSFQGFFIFLFVCVLNKEVLESWREFLSCGTYQSKLLHPTSAKVMVAKKYQTNTQKTGFGSSSTQSGVKYNSQSESLKSGCDSTTFSNQNGQQSSRVTELDSPSTKKPTSYNISAKEVASNEVTVIAIPNVTTANQDGIKYRDTVKPIRKTSVKIEIIEEVSYGENFKEKVSENGRNKSTVTIEVVEDV